MAESAFVLSRRSSPPRRRWRRGLVGVLLVAAVYVGVLPVLWPDPDVRVSVPAEVSVTAGLSVRIDVGSWHDNVRVLSARLYVDPRRSTVLLSPSTAVASLPQGGWSYTGLGRLTYPRTSRVKLHLPLVGDPSGTLPAGTARGTVDVDLEVAQPRRRGLHLLVGYPARRETRRLPVEFVVRP